MTSGSSTDAVPAMRGPDAKRHSVLAMAAALAIVMIN
jgi:hypothetical protein